MNNQTRFYFLLAQKLTGKMTEESGEEFEQLNVQHPDHCEQARVIISWWKSKQNDDDDHNVTRDAFEKILPSLKKLAQKKEAGGKKFYD